MSRKIFILIFLILLPFSISARSLEIDYPVVPGIDAPGADTTLPAYIEYLYYLIVGVAGIAVLVSFIWGGLIYLTSSGSPGKMHQGRKKIYAALGGVAIIFAAHFILINIDPQFFGGELQKPKLPTKGYCLRGHEFIWQEGNECSKGWDKTEDNSCSETIGGYEGQALQVTCCQIEPRTYCFDHHREEILPAGFVAKEISFREKVPAIMSAHFFPEKTFQGSPQVDVYNRSFHNEDIDSEIWQPVGMTGRSASVYALKHLSGFHLYPEGTYGCRRQFKEYPRYMPMYLASSRAELGEYDDRVVSIRNESMGEEDISKKIDWVGIFFTLTNYRGECGIIYGFQQAQSPPAGGDQPVPNGGGGLDPGCFHLGDISSGGIQGGIRAENISSAHVFRRQPNTTKIEGHIIFYEAANYIIPRAGEDLVSKKIDAGEILTKNERGEIWTINLKYDQGARNDRNQWDQERILSVEMTKNFIVVLNSEEDFKGKCTLLTENHPNLQHLYVLQDEQAGAKGARVKSIAIIPVQ